ncbi:MAG: hydroxymethylbilane synthase, partial [Candidatus Sumerlaeota bacterium]|nr:hydroxymethylbilane synthase [Candidatus Sumerlaeota bacterium]
MNVFTIGSRGSRLAMAQAEWAARRLSELHPGLECRIVLIQTTGDKMATASLASLGGQGVFTKEIERALLDGRIDLAVHSLKDLPTEMAEGLRLGAISEREDPADALAGARALDWRAERLRIGSSSLRRRAQLLRRNPELEIVEIRGNVPTRLEKALRGEIDAVVLAAAGLKRLSLKPTWMQTLDFADMLPAPGQGALGLQIRAGDARAAGIVAPLNDAASEAACRAERAFLRALGGGCRAPIAALGRTHGSRLTLEGMVASPDGKRFYRDAMEGKANDPEFLGRALAEALSRAGGRDIIEEISGAAEAPLIREEKPLDPAPLRNAVTQVATYDWIVFSSARAVSAFAAALRDAHVRLDWLTCRMACVGPKTAAALAQAGGCAALVAKEAGAKGLLAEWSKTADLKGARILYPRAADALPTLAEGLKALGAKVDDPPAYRTARPKAEGAVFDLLRAGECDAAAFASPSAVEALVEALGRAQAEALSMRTPFAAVGPTTSAAMQRLGLRVA